MSRCSLQSQLSRLHVRDSIIRKRLFIMFAAPPPQISSAACGYGFTLLASSTRDASKLWGMGLNKDSQLGFQRTQHRRGMKPPLLVFCSDKTVLTVFFSSWFSADQSYEYILEPSPVALPLAQPLQTRVVQVACGRAHSLVLTDQEGGKRPNMLKLK